MTAENRLHYFGCILLYGVLSAFDNLFEGIRSQRLHQKYRANSGKLEDLASKLLNEIFLAGERDGVNEEAKRVYARMVSVEPFVLDWIERVQAAARAEDKVNVTIDEETRRYYFASGWIRQILSEFVHLPESFRSSELRDWYYVNHDLFEDLTKRLQDDLSLISSHEGIAEQKATALRTAIEQIADELALDWNRKVRELSQQQ